MWLDGVALPMQAGDGAFIPKGTPHWFVNDGDGAGRSAGGVRAAVQRARSAAGALTAAAVRPRAKSDVAMAIRITRVYTRTGDKGTTALVGGERVAKDSRRVACYGAIDELNSILGLARSFNARGAAERRRATDSRPS